MSGVSGLTGGDEATGVSVVGSEADVLGTVVSFARTLRAAGVGAGPESVHALVEATRHLGALRRADLYWAGRLTLCAAAEDLPRYDRAFTAFFAGEVAGPRRPAQHVEVTRNRALPDRGGDGGAAQDEPGTAATASAVEVLRHRDLAGLDAAGREQVRHLLALLDPVGPTRRSRRHVLARRGRLDVRRTVRTTLRHGGEPVRLQRHRPRPRPRRLVLVLDVSGSMQPYAESMLRFAHAAARRRAGTEVFTLGTRLTRVTRELREREADAALRSVAGVVPDWSGGTRLGDLLKAFLDRWGQRGTARGAVVVLASDGWERGDAALLGEQMERLHRLAFRVVWVNPHKAKPGYAPVTAGMAAALPFVDDFVGGHSVAALEELARVLSAGATRGGRRAR